MAVSLASGYFLISHHFHCHGPESIQLHPSGTQTHCTVICGAVCQKRESNANSPLLMQGGGNLWFSWCLLHLSNAEEVAPLCPSEWHGSSSGIKRHTAEAVEFPSLGKSQQTAVAAPVRGGSIMHDEVGDKTLAQSCSIFFFSSKSVYVCVCVANKSMLNY